MEDEALRQARRWLEAMANGLGHKLEALTLGGLRIGSISKGLICCDFVVPNHLSDGDGNWHVGAMATLLDDLGAAAVFSVTGRVKASIDFNVSYYSTAKIQEEVEIEAKVVGQNGKFVSALVVARRKGGDGGMIALAKQWISISQTKITKSKL